MKAGLFALSTLTLFLVVGSRSSQSQEMPSSQESQESAESQAQKYFTDVVLLNQDGEEMRLYSDLLRGKIVVINSFFTSCMGICPVMAKTFAEIQDWLGDRLGNDVYLISVSVDPQTDTPAKLKEYSERLKAKPGWFFLTGEKGTFTRPSINWASTPRTKSPTHPF